MVSPLMEGSESEVREVHETSMVLRCSADLLRQMHRALGVAATLDLMKVRMGQNRTHLAQASGSLPRDATQGEVARHAGSVLNGIADPGQRPSSRSSPGWKVARER